MNNTQTTLSKQLYQEFKQSIEQNHYKVGQKLPSIRSLATKRKISTTTVLTAYNQLIIEGYIDSVERSGYIVLPLPTITTKEQIKRVPRHVFHPGQNQILDPTLFDIKTIKSMASKVYNYHEQDLLSPADPFGEDLLRDQIQKYVLKERSVFCHKNQIIIAPGLQFLLHILLQITPKKTVLTTPNQFQKAMNVFASNNVVVSHTRAFKEMAKHDLLYISPSNVYPTGEVIKMDDRYHIINWANKHQSYIIEDDYNYFMRYNAFTVPSIHSLDRQERVIYIGSFAKVLFPGMKISFMVLPPHLALKAEKMMNNHTQGVSKIDQLTMAHFMKEGLFYRHTKKLYSLYKEKNQLLMQVVKDLDITSQCLITSTSSNLHIVLTFHQLEDQEHFIHQCNKLDYHYQKTEDRTTIIFPYEGIKNSDIKETFRTLFGLKKRPYSNE